MLIDLQLLPHCRKCRKFHRRRVLTDPYSPCLMRTLMTDLLACYFCCTKGRPLAMLDRDLRNGRCVERPVLTGAKLSVDMQEWYRDEIIMTKSSASSNCVYYRKNSCSRGARCGLVLRVSFAVMRCSRCWW